MTLLLISACAPKRETKSTWTDLAPVSAREAGYVVQAQNKEQVETILSEHGGIGRALHAETGLFEIRGIEAEVLRRELGSGYVAKNIYFENLLNEEPVPQPPKPVPGEVGPVTPPATPPTTPIPGKPAPHEFKAELCKFTMNGPVAVIRPLESAVKLKKRPIGTLGDELGFTAEGSAVDQLPPEGTQVLWRLVTPKGSSLTQFKTQGVTLKIKPDLPGAYQLSMVVQDRGYRCDYATVSFGMTVNAPFKGAHAPREFNAEDRVTFKHLAAIGAETAWKRSRGEGVVLAILDSGVNYNHPDLSSNILLNEKEIAGNGIDEDGNGKIDDTLGWDFAEGDSMPYDDNRHGTHVAGLAASAVSGVAPRAKILPVKVLNAMGGGDTASILAAIMYAVDRGAVVLNASFGTYNAKMAEALKPGIEYANARGALFVAAAGNGNPATGKGMDTDAKPHFPSGIDVPSVLSVAATDLKGELSSYSNFGKASVHVAAPGGAESDGPLVAAGYLPDLKMYLSMSGTSMATPVVAGVAVLVKALNPALTGVQIKTAVMKSARELAVLKDKTSSGSLVDAAKATESPRE